MAKGKGVAIKVKGVSKAGAKAKDSKEDEPSGTAKDAGRKAQKGKKGKDRGFWGSKGDEGDLGAELAALGLRVKSITGDGNCFFRALGDQLQGDEGLHVSLRQRITSYIQDHEEDFAPFVEDDESFGTYVARMKKDGMWAGYMEVIAASHTLGANITIYQAGQPRWSVQHHPESAPVLHLSYHDGQHYNSVRAEGDYGHGPPAAIVLKGDGTMVKPAARQGNGHWGPREEELVAHNTACTDLGLVRKALEQCEGDVAAAIEKVIEMLCDQPEHTEADEAAVSAPPTAVASQVPLSALAADAASRSSWTTMPQHEPHNSPQAGQPADSASTISQLVAAAPSANGDVTLSQNESSPSSSLHLQHPPSLAAPVGSTPSEASCSTNGSSTFCNGNSSTTLISSSHISTSSRSCRMTSASNACLGDGLGSSTIGIAVVPDKRPANNKKCICGSGRKYKNCCGTGVAAAERRRKAAGQDAAAADSGIGHDQTVKTAVAQMATLLI